MTKKWTRNQKIALWAIVVPAIVAVVGMAVELMNTESRRLLGLDTTVQPQLTLETEGATSNQSTSSASQEMPMHTETLASTASESTLDVVTATATHPPRGCEELVNSRGYSLFADTYGHCMVRILADTFVMGTDDDAPYVGPSHTVKITKDFFVDIYEVTNRQYDQCVEANSCVAPINSASNHNQAYYDNPDFDEYPVIHVTWEMANTFCKWRGGRLPREAEWEYTARDRTAIMYPWAWRSSDASVTCDLLNFSGCVNDTKRVGSYPEGISTFGVYDMSGNVLEWVWDWYDRSYYSVSPKEDPSGPANGDKKVARGGSWKNNAFDVRTISRHAFTPSTVDPTLGFRCVRNVP